MKSSMAIYIQELKIALPFAAPVISTTFPSKRNILHTKRQSLERHTKRVEKSRRRAKVNLDKNIDVKVRMYLCVP